MADLAVRLTDLADETGSMAVLPALLNVWGCAGLKAEVVAGAIPDSLTAVKNLAQGLLTCAAALADPGTAAAVARAVVAAQNNITEVVAELDKKFAGMLDKVAGKLTVFGKLAGAYKVAELARAAASIWESDAEEFGRGRASFDPAGARPQDDGGHCVYVDYAGMQRPWPPSRAPSGVRPLATERVPLRPGSLADSRRSRFVAGGGGTQDDDDLWWLHRDSRRAELPEVRDPGHPAPTPAGVGRAPAGPRAVGLRPAAVDTGT